MNGCAGITLSKLTWADHMARLHLASHFANVAVPEISEMFFYILHGILIIFL